MDDWFWRSPGKAEASAASRLSPQKEKSIDVSQLLDVHTQLRHEASGLKLQLAAKQEVLERSVALLDTMSAELTAAKLTIQELQEELAMVKMFNSGGEEHKQSPAQVKEETEGDQAASASNAAGERQELAVASTSQAGPGNDEAASPTTEKPISEASISSASSDTALPEKMKKEAPAISSEASQSQKQQPDSSAADRIADYETKYQSELNKNNDASTLSAAAIDVNERPRPRSAAERIAAYEELLAKQNHSPVQKPPELAPACRITKAARVLGDPHTPR